MSSSSSSSATSNPNPWSPYETYKDCSLGICSRYCPQWCYIVFPPPPPEEDSDDGSDFSPLVIAVIGILASAFLLVTYYAIISRYCRRRRNTSGETGTELGGNPDQNGDEPRHEDSAGLEEALIKTIRVCKYKKNDGFVEGTDCSVCLSEFVEDESLRLLPKCNHAFHLPCIDAWLKNQATCPLCRSALNPLPLRPAPPAPARETSRNVRVSALQHLRSNDTVLVVRDLERVVVRQEGVVVVEREIDDSGNRGMRRSVSLDSVTQPELARISDILEEIEEDEEDGQIRSENPEIGSLARSDFVDENSKSGVKLKSSTGRFMFTRNGKSRSSTIIHP